LYTGTNMPEYAGNENERAAFQWLDIAFIKEWGG
jgi:hypothetical protein